MTGEDTGDAGARLVHESVAHLLGPLRELGFEDDNDDLLYGPAVYQKLPAWMRGAEEEDQCHAPARRKLAEVGANDDGETTSPPSDLLAELSSGSDDEPQLRERRAAMAAAAASSNGGAGRSFCRWAAPPFGDFDCLGTAAASGADPSDCLVDLDPEEGRRRGAEILALLMERPSAAEASMGASSVPLGVGAPPALPPPGQPRVRGWQPPLSTAPLGDGENSSEPQSSLSCNAPPAGGSAQTIFAALCEAACRAFGVGTADVVSSASGGFVVWLCGWPAAELQRSQQAVLEAFGQALWPLLGQDVVGVEQQRGAARPGGLTSGPRLTVWCLCEEARKYEQSFCWQFVRHGMCPRGSLCRWLHTMPPSYPIDIEVAASA